MNAYGLFSLFTLELATILFMGHWDLMPGPGPTGVATPLLGSEHLVLRARCSL